MNNEPSSLSVRPASQVDLSPQTFEQALTFSNYLADSDLVPKDFKGKPGNCLIAMQWGAELGLKPLQALSNIAVINGRAALWGDAVIALVRSNPLCEFVQESDDGHTATCKVKRRGEAQHVSTFSMDDAQTAGLKGKPGPWTQYPKRMRQMRARAFALRDVFPDILRGMPVAEEVFDTPENVIDPSTGEINPAQTPARQELQAYPEADFNANLASWRKVVESGRKTPADLIAMVSTKGVLSDAQKTAIQNLAPIEAQTTTANPAANAEQGDVDQFVKDME
ncbi:hypothetical protein B9Z51_08830 [Limnohabitans sp. T6-5]|uniref:hypothetical protein n=1 Tax=Limnohabitans sp. T6-5 TaxID=1100724 RepID=UPI000DD1B86D|nr:hypothetical protein [Limnohabitans sp. T6-5]PUE09025.1 hypothetical protein B9Z51_08830 [Limnohabitans sp. T6-5]